MRESNSSDVKRTLVQREFFTASRAELPDELYSRVERGKVTRDRSRAALQPHSRVSTNTYFGRLPVSYWQRWTQVTELELAVDVTGAGKIALVASDSAGVPRTVEAVTIGNDPESGAGAGEPGTATTVRLSVRLDRFLDGGAAWFEASTDAEPLEVSDVRWNVPSGKRPRRQRPTAVAMCTHNRAGDCLNTLEQMLADDVAMEFIDTVYVVDQGTDPVESRERFREVQRKFGSKLHYLRQANLGGAGGFTRAMCAAIDSVPGESNVLLMDDDITIEPDTLVRVTAFAYRTTSSVLVGGQMLGSLHPHQLLADAEYFDAEKLRVGLPITKSLSRANMLWRRQDVRVDAPYNAWWTCLIPSEAVRGSGLPLPLFFQWDDVEFGIRAGSNGFATVTLPGAGVWHSDLHWKNWDDWSRYFHFRNGLVVSALHSGFDIRKITTNLACEVACCLASMQYGLAATMIKAIEDFLRGPAAFDDGGVEVVERIREMRSEYPETVTRPAGEVDFADATQVRDPGRPSMPVPIFVKRVLWHALGRNRRSAAVAASDAGWWHLALFRKAVVSDPSQSGVRVYQYDGEMTRNLVRRGARVLLRLYREGPAVRRRYVEALPEWTGRANWHRLFAFQPRATSPVAELRESTVVRGLTFGRREGSTEAGMGGADVVPLE